MTVHARFATVLAAAAVLVIVSATTGAVAASLITSKDIKDGTIEPRDLDKQLNASLHKAASALQAVPRNSVTSANVRDRSLRLRDLETAAKTEGFHSQLFPAGQCTTIPPVNTGYPTAGAIVLATSNLDQASTTTGAPDPSHPDAIDITVCLESGGPDYYADGADGDTFSWRLFAD